MRALKLGALALPYLVAVVGANLIVKHYGASSTPYVAFFLVAAALIFRDQFADMVGYQRVLIQLALIATGALLTYLINQDAALIAKASVIAFTASEIIEGGLYIAWHKRPWMDRAPGSAAVAAAVDSVLFISIAFGFTFSIAFAQWVAKVAGAWLWARVIQEVRTRRAVLARNA